MVENIPVAAWCFVGKLFKVVALFLSCFLGQQNFLMISWNIQIKQRGDMVIKTLL